MGGYAGFDADRFVVRHLSSWDDAGWRSLLVQRFEHLGAAGAMTLPASTDHHLWLITGGAGLMRLQTADGWREHPIVAGHVGRATPGVPTEVRYTASTPMSSVHVHLPVDVVERVTGELGRRPASCTDDDDLLAPLLRSVAAAADQRADAMYADAAAEFLAVHLATRSGGTSPGREDARVRKAITLMREQLDQPLTLADLAAAAWLSPYHFLRVFKQATGETPARYRTRLRVREAARLLDAGRTVSEAAVRCGFSSPAHLSSAFLRETGMRPSQYRLR